MPSANKFAILSEVNTKKRQIVVSEGLIPKKKASSPTVAAPKDKTTIGSAAAGRVAKPLVAHKPKAAAAPASDAPTDLRAAAAFNKKKAEERAARLAAEAEAKAVAERAAAEAHAVKVAAEQAAAETQAEGDAQKEVADEQAQIAAESAPKKEGPKEPERKVMTLADYAKERAETQFSIGAKQARQVDKSATAGLQKLAAPVEGLVIKKKEEVKAPVKAAAGKKTAAPAPKAAEPKPKSTKVDLAQFADYSAAGRGRGFGGRGGYRGGMDRGAGARAPNYDDQKAFPSL